MRTGTAYARRYALVTQMTEFTEASRSSMIAGVATVTIVVSTRIMKKPMQRAINAGQGFTPCCASGCGATAEGLCSWVTAPLNTVPWTITPMSFPDLMAGPPPTLLPEDPAAAPLADGEDPRRVVVAHP